MNIFKKFFDKAYIKPEAVLTISPTPEEFLKAIQFSQSPKKEKKNRFDLMIYLKDGSDFGYNVKTDTKHISCIAIFYPFYRWFYEKDSPYYTYSHNQGADIIIRSEIRNITMRRKEIGEEIKE